MKRRVITVARAQLAWLRATVLPDFEEIMREHFRIWDDNDFHKSEMIYRFKNASMIRFIGLDKANAQKIHGMKQDITYINEAIECNKKQFNQLALRTTEKIFLDYNPSTDSHWIYDSVIPRNDCTFIKSTYKDNPFLEQAIIDEIERLQPTPENIAQGTADEVSWKIYGLGERATQRGLIFGDARIVDEMPPPEDCKKRGIGLDFGFTNDPTAIIDCALAHGELWFDQLVYERGLVNCINPLMPNQKSIEGEFVKLGVKKTTSIRADGAEPKSIAEIRGKGYLISAARKGKDSVLHGIQLMKKYRINITKRSVDLIKERNNYKWLEDTQGNSTNVPIDAFNHGWDAGRYWCVMELGPQAEPGIR